MQLTVHVQVSLAILFSHVANPNDRTCDIISSSCFPYMRTTTPHRTSPTQIDDQTAEVQWVSVYVPAFVIVHNVTLRHPWMLCSWMYSCYMSVYRLASYVSLPSNKASVYRLALLIYIPIRRRIIRIRRTINRMQSLVRGPT